MIYNIKIKRFSVLGVRTVYKTIF